MHASFAQWLVEPSANLVELFAHSAAEDQHKIKTAYKKKVGADISMDELAPFHEGVALGMAMCRNYQDKWGSPLPTGFTVVYPEQKIEVPIPNSFSQKYVYVADGDYTDVVDEQDYLDLRLDGFIREDRTGDLYIIEHKTYSSRPNLGVLQMNDQFLAYMWGARQAGIGHVRGVAYDGLWKRAMPPRGKVADDLFTRFLITRPDFEVNAFGSQIWAEVRDMARQALTDKDSSLLYPNRRWEGCYDCQFEQMCAMQSRGEDYLHYRNTHYVKLDADKNILEEDEE